jgi:hypothetical protein
LLKFGGWWLTGSASLLSSAVHSIASITDQAVLLSGSKLSDRKADERHPFGYARERYVFAFLVSLVVFTLGGIFALRQGYNKAMDVRAGHPGKLLHSHWWWVPIVILAGNLISQSLNFRSVRHAQHQEEQQVVAAVHRLRHSLTPDRQAARLVPDEAQGRWCSAWASRCPNPVTGGDPRRRTVSPTIIRLGAEETVSKQREVKCHGTPCGHWA